MSEEKKSEDLSVNTSGELMHLDEAEDALANLQARATGGDKQATEELCMIADEILEILVALASTNDDKRAAQWLGYRSELWRNKIPESSPKNIKTLLRENEATKKAWDRAASWAEYRFKGSNERKIHKRSQKPLVQWVELAVEKAAFWREIQLGIVDGNKGLPGIFELHFPAKKSFDGDEEAFEKARTAADALRRKRWADLVGTLRQISDELSLGEGKSPPFPGAFVKSGTDAAFLDEIAIPLLETAPEERKQTLGIPALRGDLRAAIKTALENFREVSIESLRRRKI